MRNKDVARIYRSRTVSFGKRSGVTTTVFAVVVIILLIIAGAATYFATVHISTSTATIVSTSVSTSIATSVSTLATTVVSTTTSTATTPTHTILDQAGNYVTLPVTITRVADATGFVTDAIVALGAQSTLVSTEFDAQSPTSLLYKWTNLFEPGVLGTGSSAWNSTSGAVNIEAMAALNPQVVFTWNFFGTAFDSPQLYQQLGIPVVQLQYYGNITTLDQSMTLLGSILGPAAATRAQEWNTFVNYNINYINSTLEANHAAPVSAAEVAFNTPSAELTYNSVEASASFLQYVGATNAANSICSSTQHTCSINDEELLALNPPVLFIDGIVGAGPTLVNLTTLQADPVLSQLTAVKTGQVYVDPYSMGPWAGTDPERVLLIPFAAWKLYPTLFPESYFVNQTEYYYKTFYNYNVNQTLINDMLSYSSP